MLQKGDGGKARTQTTDAAETRWGQSTNPSIRIGLFNSSFGLELCHDTLQQ